MEIHRKTLSKKAIILRITLIVIITIMVLTGVNYKLNKMYYYPENPTTGLTPLKVMTQLIAPEVQNVYAFNSFNTPHLFSHSKLTVSLSSMISDNRPNYTEDRYEIDFRFGKARASYLDARDFGDITIPQEEFLRNDTKRSVELFRSVKKDKYYVAKLSFIEPMKLESLTEKYRNIMGTKIDDNVSSNLYFGGVIWLPIKTSDVPNDICIGAMGPNSAYYTSVNEQYKNLSSVNGTDYKTIELCFSDALNYMADNIDEANIYLKSGLFKNSDSLDFSKRLNYVEQNGYSCLGMVVYIRGDDLLSLETDENLVLCTLSEQ